MSHLITLITILLLINLIKSFNVTNQTSQTTHTILEANHTETLNLIYLFEWQNWKQLFNKSYLSVNNRILKNKDVEMKRFEIFKENLIKIHVHNSLNRMFRLSPNAFTDLTIKELNSRFHISIDMSQLIHYHNKIGKLSVNSTNILADYVDWAKSGYMAPIDDQGVCGSCYTFATASAVESAYAIKMNLKNKVINLSEQQLLDCAYFTNGFSNFGCNGGFAYPTLLYIFNHGIQSAYAYPYVGTRKTCNYDQNKIVTKISDINGIEFGDFKGMKEALNKQPLIAHMYVPPDFYYYRSGIYSSNMCPPNCSSGINHMVTIVGYGIDKNINISYWLVRNHWGTQWGESGYFRIIMGKNMCCIEGYEYYPII